MSRKDQVTIERLKSVPVPKGMERDYYKCKCGRIVARQYVPYGLGHGATLNPCICSAVDSNWIFRAKRLSV